MQLGPLSLSSPFLLAPMAGVSEEPFRVLARELGAGLAPTELVSAAGLVRASARTAKYLRHADSERPFVVQLFGGEPESMARAALLAKDAGADALDINLGCPVPKVTKSGAGSALLADPGRAAAIVRACREATGLPVSAKLRSGWDARHLTFLEVAGALEEAGVAFVALHPRTRAQGYSGRADWTLIAKLRRALRRTPVVGNGDVASPSSARAMIEETGCDAVMVGRAALGNPWIFRELSGGAPPDREERRSLVLRHFDAHLAFVGRELPAVREFRRHFGWYSRGLEGSAAFRCQVNQLSGASEVRRLAERFFAAAEARPRDGDALPDLAIAYG